MLDQWQSSFREAFRSSDQLYQFLGIEEKFADEVYPVFVTKNLAKRIKVSGEHSPLWRQFVPDRGELDEQGALGLYDPIGDSAHSKGSGIIHRYKNRLLFSPTTICPVNCRYCFRKNELAQKDEILKGKLDSLLTYLGKHPEVEEVILTGGDPLMLSDGKLEEIITALSGKVKYLRLHSRVPVVMPERITQNLCSLFETASKCFEVFSLAIHANHTQEFDESVINAIKSLRACAVQLLSQSVLLKGVNDSAPELIALFKLFSRLGIRPYYLHHPDRVKGAMKYSLSLEKGRQIYSTLRNELPGWAIPHYVIDPENGQGKNLAYNPESLHFSGQLLDRFNQVHELKR